MNYIGNALFHSLYMKREKCNEPRLYTASVEIFFIPNKTEVIGVLVVIFLAEYDF